MWAEIIVAIILLALGTFASYMLVRYSRKHKEENAAE